MEDNITPIKEKLDDKIKKLNSSRVFKKVTPKGDILVYQVGFKYGVNLMYGKCKCKLIYWNLYFGMIGVAGWFWEVYCGTNSFNYVECCIIYNISNWYN